MTNRHLVAIIALLLALLALGVHVFLRADGSPRPRVADFTDPGEEPPVKLHALLSRRKPTGEPEPPRPGMGPGATAETAGFVDLSRRLTGEARAASRYSIPSAKRKDRVGAWSDSPAYRALLAPPEPSSIHPEYAEILERKADEIARAAGFNRSFGHVIESALRNPSLAAAERIFEDGKLEDALLRFTELLKSDNLYLRSVAAAYIMRIHDLRGDKARTDAARANLAVLSAQVAKEAFPDAVAKMGAESPAVKRAMEALAGGELMKITLPSDEPAAGAPAGNEETAQ